MTMDWVSRDFKKTNILLEALHKASRNVLYIAVDLNTHNLKKGSLCYTKMVEYPML